MTLLTPDFLATKSETFQAIRYLLQQHGSQQSGVMGASDFLVSQRASGGSNLSVDVAVGDAWILGTTVTRQGIYHLTNDGTVNISWTAGDSTNPRLDQLYLVVNDSAVAGLSDVPSLSPVTGTPTSGATLDNRTGFGATPPNAILLADILVPVGATSIVNANIRDRRAFARGFFNRLVKTSSPPSVAAAISATGYIDSTNLSMRVECTGNPYRVTLQAVAANNAANQGVETALSIDGAYADGVSTLGRTVGPVANSPGWVGYNYVTVPPTGSHVFRPVFGNVIGGTATISASTTQPIVFTVEELVRQNVNDSPVGYG